MNTSAIDRGRSDRRFFGGMAIAMMIVVFAGFAPSFFLRGLIHVPRPNPSFTPLIWLHGLIFTAWMLIFFTQTRLVATGRRDLHMKLGIWSFGLAAMLPIIAFYTALGQIARANQPPFVTPLTWSALPLFGVPALVLFIWLGWRYRRDAQAHKRLMLILALCMMEPAIGRLPLGPPSFVVIYIGAALAWAMIIPLMIYDWRTLGRLHWATLLGASFIAGLLIVRSLVWTTQGWQDFARMLGS